MKKYRIQYPALEYEEEKYKDPDDHRSARCVAVFSDVWLAEKALAKYKNVITDLCIEAFDSETGEAIIGGY